jgi:cyclohexanone monooxygenase
MQHRKLSVYEQVLAKRKYPELFARRSSPPGNFCDIFRLDKGAYDVSDTERLDVFEAAWQKGGFNFWIGTFNDILTNEASNRAAYNFWRDKTRSRIDDIDVAEKLAPMQPPYPFGTKRPSLEQNYYECFNQKNVELVDISSTPIETILTSGVKTISAEFDLDILVLATGFDANTGGLTNMDIRGQEGQVLSQTWANGVDTHLGTAIPGFPNFLMLYGPQSATAFCNGPTCAEFQGEWTTRFLNWMRGQGYKVFDASQEAAASWTERLAGLAQNTLFGRTDSWYMGANIPGKKRQLLNYPDADAYRDQLRACENDSYSGFSFR